MELKRLSYLLSTKQNLYNILKLKAMKNSMNLNSQEWCDIIFKDKNKAYGAYAMRQSSNKRHLIAFGSTILLVVAVSLLPTLISKINASQKADNEGVKDIYSVMQVDNTEKEPEKIIETAIPEPPKYVNMVKFVPPTIVEDTKADDGEMPNVSDITENKDAVGAFTITNGSNDPDAIRKEADKEIMDDGTSSKGAEPVQTLIRAEIMPQFPGGDQEMYRYIGENLKYPVPDQEAGIQGRVTVRFVVSKTGEIKDVEVLRGISPTCDKEALRVIKSMPKWIPGRQNGNPAQVYFTIPVVFKLRN